MTLAKRSYFIALFSPFTRQFFNQPIVKFFKLNFLINSVILTVTVFPSNFEYLISRLNLLFNVMTVVNSDSSFSIINMLTNTNNFDNDSCTF